ncbi:lantibiotic dehydratase [Streptomyces sp. NPDC055078]
MSVFGFGPVAMARIPLLPSDTSEPSRAAGLFEEGLFLASRSLEQADSDSSRAAETRTAYAIRARARTAPQGVWCAVAVASLEGRESVLRLGERHRPVSVPSPQWLLGVADQVLELPGVVPGLELTVSNLVVRRGGRFEAEHPGPAGGGQLGSVRVTDLSAWLVTACAGRALGSGVIAAVLDRYPGATIQDAERALVQLIRTGILLTDLLPDDLRDDPIGHLLRVVPASAPEHGFLVRLRHVLDEADRHPPGAAQRLGLLRAARDLSDRIHRADRPLTVDTLADAELRLPAAVGAKAARAAEVLWRISHRTPALRSWSDRFATAYGHHRMVPLLEAVDPAVGIGAPDAGDAIAAAAELDERRGRLLASLLADALTHGRAEVELTEAHITGLEHGAEDGGGPPPRTAEIHVRVLPGPDGPVRLLVGRHAAQTAGSAAGRFAYRLPQLAPEPATEVGGPVVAEIVCRPLTAQTAGLAVETGFAPYRIPIGVPARDGDLHPRDLAVVSTGKHLALWSHTLRRRIVPVLFSRITRDLLPPAAQLLHLLGHSRERPWHTWSWGPAARFPYTPRVSHRGTILAPQRWLLPDDLVTAAARRTAWHPHLTAWLTGTHPAVPTMVVVEESDRQLPLRLDDTGHREILRRTVLRGTRTLTEAIGHHDHEHAVAGPEGRHPLELVIALHRTTAPATVPIDPRTAPRARPADTQVPGGDWLSAALPVPVRHQDDALRRLPPAAAGGRCFWLRYRTPALGPHLRLRFPTTPGSRHDVWHSLARWSARLAEQRLSSGHLHYEPYLRETQRYGGPHAIDAAEDVFAADSALALTTLGRPADDDERLVLAAHSAAAIARLLASPPAARGGPLTHSERRRRERLRTTARTHTVPPWLAPAWTARQEALHTYRTRLSAPDTAERCASDLIHLHCNRLLGTDAGQERIARSLAIDLLHAHGRHG